MKRLPLPWAIFYEIILILVSFSFPPLWIYAIINAIPLIISIGKYQYENHEDFKNYELEISSKNKAEKDIDKLLYENNKIRLRYTYTKQLDKDTASAKPYFFLDVCESIFPKYDIKHFILKESKNNKNIFYIFNKFSVNYAFEPQNLIEYINILDNEIRFLALIFEIYNIEIVDNSYDFSSKIHEEKNLKKFWLNYLLFQKMTLNKYLCKVIKLSASNKSIDQEFLKSNKEHTLLALSECFDCFEELTDEQLNLKNFLSN